jgi:hypothetical protein
MNLPQFHLEIPASANRPVPGLNAQLLQSAREGVHRIAAVQMQIAEAGVLEPIAWRSLRICLLDGLAGPWRRRFSDLFQETRIPMPKKPNASLAVAATLDFIHNSVFPIGKSTLLAR